MNFTLLADKTYELVALPCIITAMVTIIIPYINEVEYLQEAIASARAQQGVETEIVVVCNASTLPESYNPLPMVVKDYTFIHEPRPGSAFARNAGLSTATGDWIQFLDVDDLLHPEKIQHQLLSTDHADVIVSPHTYLDLQGKSEHSKWLHADFWSGLLNSGLGSTSSMLWKRRALEEVGGWNINFQSHQEYELLFRLAVAGKIIVTDDHCETIVRQRLSGSITDLSKPVRIREGIELREQMWHYLQSKELGTPERFDAFRQYVFRQLRGLFRQDTQAAMIIIDKYFLTPPFTPRQIHIPGYTFLYRLFGFERTEKIINIFVMVRNAIRNTHKP